MATQRRVLRSAAAAATSMEVDSQEEPSGTQAESSSLQGVTSQMSQVNIAEEAGTSQENENVAEVYGDMHKMILQGVMAAGYLDAKGVKKLFQEASRLSATKLTLEEVIEPRFIQKVVREINEKIKVFDMVIRSATCEVSGEKFYVYLVTVEMPVMKYQTFFSKMELEYFQKVMLNILRSNRFTLSITECLNLVDGMDTRAFSKTYAEHFIQRMIVMQYLTRLPSVEDVYNITLGFRTIREFEPVFSEDYKDCFTKCCLCKMILLNGLQCPRCTAVIHRGCLIKYLQASRICASCNGPWRKKGLLVRTLDGVGRKASPPPPAPQGSEKSAGPPATKRTRMAEKAKAAAAATSSADTARSSGSGDVADMPILEPMTPLRVSPRKASVTTPTPSTSAAARKAMGLPIRASRRNKQISSAESDSD